MTANGGFAASRMMRPSPTMDPAAVLHDRELLAGYVQTLKMARAVDVRQGSLEIVTATVAFDVGVAGAIAQGVKRTAFLDNLNDNQSSGLVQTYADGNLFGGKIPSGELVILRGMGINIEATDPEITAQDINQIGRNISVLFQLRRTPVNAGSVRDWPELIGARGTGNGNPDSGVVPFSPPVVLEPLQDYTVTFEVVRPISLTVEEGSQILLHIRNPAMRVYDPIVLGKS
jgi:hypothetical protein